MLLTIITGIVLGLVLGVLVGLKNWPGIVLVSILIISSIIVLVVEPDKAPDNVAISDKEIIPVITIDCYDNICDTIYIYNGRFE